MVEGYEKGSLANVDVEGGVDDLDVTWFANVDHAAQSRVVALTAVVLDDNGGVIPPPHARKTAEARHSN